MTNESLPPSAGTEINKALERKVENLTLNISQEAIETLSFGESKGLAAFINKNGENVEMVFWNEEYITIKMKGTFQRVVYFPELSPEVKQFFEKREKEKDRDIYDGNIVWSGDYETVRFGKNALLSYLNANAEAFDNQIIASIKNLKIEKKSTDGQISIGGDEGEGERIVEEEVTRTNIPSEFSAKMRIAENVYAEMKFKAKVVRNRDKYGNIQKGFAIELNLLNARQIKRDMMGLILSVIPKEIPVVYGKYAITPIQERKIW